MQSDENCETCTGRLYLSVYVTALLCLAAMTLGGLVTAVLVSVPFEDSS